ncbi:MAG: hypothetical protein NZ772_06930 [Cyanobacteria bacterium]|nr:hypothetical protein [Cyanobacteriota bacterium]MDW8201245.1 hypothetical protein [Cyanobacteriota bacterium SKYGB_h_bin112]
MNSFSNPTDLDDQSKSHLSSDTLLKALPPDSSPELNVACQPATPNQLHDSGADKLQGAAFVRSQLEKPLEARLIDAGLLSRAQLIVLRQDQYLQPDLTVEEILRLRGWINDTVLNFFMHLEQALLDEFKQLSIGQRLKYAGLVTDAQLEIAIAYQQQTRIRMGHAIFLSGILSQTTVDYFLQF